MQLFTYLQNIIDELHSVVTNYSEKVLRTIEEQQTPGAAYVLKKDPYDHTPYTTIAHRDLWVTNVMFKYGTTLLFINFALNSPQS